MKRKKSCNHPPSIDPFSNLIDPSAASSSPFVNNSREKMKRKKNCNHSSSINPSSIINPSSTNPVNPTSNPIDPSFNASSSSNPISNPPQVEIENKVKAEDEDEAQDVPNSSTCGLPPLNDLPPLTIFGHLLVRMGRKMEEFENTQNEMNESLK
ncbi:unnamed protein product, partial [Ilex paraguariensis]